ncbi:MAG: TIGR03905 family TSCPD domain-containing protein [Firmicutes bacterium]|nr:TIGR03905 family TSCPD domain-containing protein [Bacillota bacterium]
MKYSYRPQGVCSRLINFDVTDGKVSDVSFVGGCDGNLKAIGKLVEGHDAEEVINILKGNTCGYKSTSCADQLAIALKQAMEQQAQ